MLRVIGVDSVEALFESIPSSIRLGRMLELPKPLPEWKLKKHIESFASQNSSTRTHLSLLGGGAYEHYIPAVVDSICSRGEFLTAYTPYQPEMSQGLLQVLYEYQLLLSKVLAMEAVNCSLYDGATAAAEGAWLACSATNRRRVLVADTLWPHWLDVMRVYLQPRGVKVEIFESDRSSGLVNHASLRPLMSGDVASVIVQTPNALGVVEDLALLAELAHDHGALLHVAAYPMLLGLARGPGADGADVVTCEGQSLGLPLNAGGPYLGVFATRKKYLRYMPGRIVGMLTDLRGDKAYALTREEREQHVSREQATSHICSNQALQAMRAAIYLSTVGEVGFREIAAQCATKAAYLADRLIEIEGVRLARGAPFFNEFAIEIPCDIEALLELLANDGIFGGISVGGVAGCGANTLLIAVTEVRTREELDGAAVTFRRAISQLTGRNAS